MMKLMKRSSFKIFCAALVCLLALGLTACGGSDEPAADGELQKVTVVLDWTPNTNHTGMYVAIANGYYEEAGLEVEIVSPPEDGALAMVAAGQAQFGIDFQESLASALTADVPLPVTAVAAIIDHNTSGIISAADKNITSFKDMENHNYATWNTPIEAAILRQVMANQGGDYDLVEKIPNTITDAASAIQTDIDTIWVYEAWDKMAIDLAGIESNYIDFAEADPVLDFYTPIIVANNDYIATQTETAKAFMQATARGYEYAIENPAAAADILLAAVPELSAELVIASQEFLAGEYKAEKAEWGLIDEARWTAFYDWMFEQGLIPTELGSAGFTNELLQ